jgi:MoaA/NifB/PqqE/SkfB family radical SAM enzyme
MKTNMAYRIMRVRKYYDYFRVNKPLLNTPLKQKYKIVRNILRFFISNTKKSLIIKNKPVTAQVESTSQCNLKCKMCMRDKTGTPIGNLSFENFKKILDKLDCLFKISISGQGEPFLNPELFKMINYANKKGVVVNINSNGTLLNDEIIEKICKSNIGEMGISIDSTKKEKYEKIRRGANFDELIKNMKKLTSELDRKKKNTIITMTPIIFKDNIDELPEFVILAKKLGVRKIAFQTLQTKEDYIKSYDKGMKSQIVKNRIEKLTQKIKEAKELADKYKITFIFDEEKSPGCIWPWRGIYITWNGNVTPCCKILDYNNPRFGNILEENFWSVWNGKEYQRIRELLRNRKVPLCCKGCNRV